MQEILIFGQIEIPERQEHRGLGKRQKDGTQVR